MTRHEQTWARRDLHANFFDLAAIFVEIVANWTLPLIFGRLIALVSGRIPVPNKNEGR